jgi:hypothetical protein
MKVRRRTGNPLKKKARKGFRGYPIATIAHYGPDDKIATKVAVGIANEKDEIVALERWHSGERYIRYDQEIIDQILAFIRRHSVRSVGMTDRIIGCPHEEGIDYPEGENCPQCLYWANRDRWTGELIH